MQPKVLRLLGLAKRAGKIACGMDAVMNAAGGSMLVILANDAGNSVKRKAERSGTQTMTLPYTKEELGRAIGRKTCAIAALADKEFTRGILEALNGRDSFEHSDQIPHS
jgi:ribosomal protein L7Ae-like RNA K-turn-binding protein